MRKGGKEKGEERRGTRGEKSEAVQTEPDAGVWRLV